MKWTERNRYIAKVTVSYGALATLWILLSDRLLGLFAEPAQAAEFGTAKGLLFVAATTMLLWAAMLTVPAEGEVALGQPGRPPAWVRVVLSLAIPLLAFVLHRALWQDDTHFPWVLFYPAVFLSSWAGGLAGGLVSTVLSVLLVWFGLIQPRYSFAIEETGSALSIAIFFAMGVLFSLTHRRLQQVERRAADAKFRALVDQSLAGIYIVQDGRFRYANPAFAGMFGHAPDAILDVAVETVVDAADRAMVSDRMRQCVEAATPELRFAFSGRRLDGSTFEVEIHGRSFEHEGRPAVIGVAIDVSERLRAEETVKRSEQLTRAVVEGSPDAVFVKDKDGRYLLFNEAAARIVGKPAAEVIGKDDRHIFPPDVAASIIALDRDLMDRGKVQTHEEALLTLDGQRMTFLVTKGPLLDLEGRVVGLFGISHDITERLGAEQERQRQEEELRQRNEELERFNRASVGRELDMIALKRQVNELSHQLGRPPPFPLEHLEADVPERPKR